MCEALFIYRSVFIYFYVQLSNLFIYSLVTAPHTTLPSALTSRRPFGGNAHNMGGACVSKCQTDAALMQLEPTLPIGGEVTLERGKAKLFPKTNQGNKLGVLSVQLMECRQLGNFDLFGSDPYLTLQIGGQWYRSKGKHMDGFLVQAGAGLAEALALAGIVDKSTAQDFAPTKAVNFESEQFIFDVFSGTPAMHLSVWDRDTFTADDNMGQACVFLDGLADGLPHDRWFALSPNKSEGRPMSSEKKLAGDVRLRLHFIPDGSLICGKCGFTMKNTALVGHVEADEFALGRESRIRKEFEEPDVSQFLAHSEQAKQQSVSARNTFWCAWANERKYYCKNCGACKWDPLTFVDTSIFSHWQSPFTEVSPTSNSAAVASPASGEGSGDMTTEVGVRVGRKA